MNLVRQGIGIKTEENYKDRQRERRKTVRHLANQNFTVLDKFITLTFAKNIQDPIEANKLFKKYVRALKTLGMTKYLAVIEFQDENKRGAVHYHMLCKMPYVYQKKLKELWGHGTVTINAIKEVDNIGAYIVKYMSKHSDDERLKGIKAYNCSKGLDRPKVLKSWNPNDKKEVDEIMTRLMAKEKPVYSATYTSEHLGIITHLQFNPNRKSYKINTKKDDTSKNVAKK